MEYMQDCLSLHPLCHGISGVETETISVQLSQLLDCVGE